MAQLMLHRDLLKAFGKLPVQVQKRIADFVDRFRENPADPALHLHALKASMVDSKVRGADLPNGYRAIIIAPEKGDTYIMVHVDKHDDAYAWAKNKRFEVHELTGIFQIFDSEVVTAVADKQPPAPKATPYPLNVLSEDEFFQAGNRFAADDIEEEARQIGEMLEVVAWYHTLISAKLGRAVHGLLERDDVEGEIAEIISESRHSDANGSGKVALVAIERSIAAWLKLREALPSQEDTILAMLALLDRMRRRIQIDLPESVTFRRPGFDGEDVGLFD